MKWPKYIAIFSNKGYYLMWYQPCLFKTTPYDILIVIFKISFFWIILNTKKNIYHRFYCFFFLRIQALASFLLMLTHTDTWNRLPSAQQSRKILLLNHYWYYLLSREKSDPNEINLYPNTVESRTGSARTELHTSYETTPIFGSAFRAKSGWKHIV